MSQIIKLRPSTEDLRSAARALTEAAHGFALPHDPPDVNFAQLAEAASFYLELANEAGEGHYGRVPIVRAWVSQLGLRHQGVLVSAIRGPDGAAKEDPTKWIVRFMRSCVLRAHVGDPAKALTYMVWTESADRFMEEADRFITAFDNLPIHFLQHFMLAAEICGYKMPEPQATWWRAFYFRIVRKLHLNPETEAELDARLSPDERAFKASQE